MLGFTGLAFGDAGKPVKPAVPAQDAARSVAAIDADGEPIRGGDNHPLAASAALAAPPANDTCAGAVPLPLNHTTYGTTVDANDDYQSPATAACFPGDGQSLTAATGRDVVYSFTAPADGKYTFRSTARSATSAIYSQNVVLYLTDCANAGTVNCLKGANSRYQQTGVGSLGQSNGVGESVNCYPMTSGQTTFLIFDDGPPGRCSNNSHTCVDDSYCAAGATCVPQINVGGEISIDVVECVEEVEPNDTPATASPLTCGVTGASGVAPVAHCYLGTRAGNPCTRPYAAVSFLDQANPDSNMRCNVSGAMCVIDVQLGTDNCAPGTGPCQQQTDLDCDPRCDIGPNAGKSCASHAFCNPVSDQGATCAGSCQIESTCIDNLTGLDTGVACTPTCQNSVLSYVNGRYCSSTTGYSGCPGAGVCVGTALAPQPGATCVTGQTCGRQFNEGDTDYFSIGSPAAGSKVFAAVWANNANDYDYRLRVTTDTNTLQWDDNDTVSFFGGSFSAIIGGAVTDGTPSYIGVSRTNPRTTSTYQVYSIVRPPLAAAQLEDESGPVGNSLWYYWPGDVIIANPVSADGYIQGLMNYPGDTDCFKFLVNEGDLIDMYGDGNPSRAVGDPVGSTALVSNPFPLVFDAEPAGISNFVFGTEVKKNVAPNVQGPGLRALSPAVTSAYVQWRASYTGMLEVCYYDLRNFYQTSGPQLYPTPWAGSLSVNCGPVQPAGPGTTTAEVSLTKTGPAGPVETGEIVQYVITVTNEGSEIAQAVELFDNLDLNLTFVSLTVDDTLGGGNTACYSLPTLGANDAPIDCVNASMAPGTSTIYTLTVQVNNCIGSGIDIPNTAEIIASDSTDPDPGNNSATTSFTTVAQADNGCRDIVCDEDLATCFDDPCTTNSFCDAGACNNTEVADCDDNSVCTDDSCVPATGCVNDASQVGDLCDDFDPCTANACDPLAFCVFPFEVLGTACDDGVTCTDTDQCDGQGTCAGSSVCDDGDACSTDSCDSTLGCVTVPITCDDGNVCNGAETCSPASGCVAGTAVVCSALDQCHDAGTCSPGTGLCSNPVKPTGTACADSNLCTTGDTCNAAGACAGGPAPICTDDGDACTAEICDPASGCAWSLANFDVAGFSASRVDGRDLVVLADAWSSCSTDPNYDLAANLDHVGCIDLDDFHLFMNTFGRSCQ